MRARTKPFALTLIVACFFSFVSNGEEIRTLLLPVSFSDCCISHDIAAISEKTEAAAAYFKSQTGDTFFFTTGPVTSVRHTLSYYGANSLTAKDALLPEAVIEACTKANATVDFSKYRHIIIFAAGPSEADGAGSEKIWPQATSLGPMSIILDGKKIDEYGVCCEIGPDGCSLSGIGDLCHELGHLIGLKDLYDISSEPASADISRGLGGTLSLMDRGNRLDGGRTPSLLSAVDLEYLGKGKGETLAPGHHILPARGQHSDYMKLAKPGDEDEFFLIECRRRSGQDSFIDREGLITYHVDRSGNDAGWSAFRKKNLKAAERWEYNEVNVNPEHECAFVCDKLVFWNGTTPTLAIRNARDLEDGSVEFDVLEAIAIEELTVFQDAAILKWRSDFEDGSTQEASIELKKHGGEWTALPGSRKCILIDNLDDGADYYLRIKVKDTMGDEFSHIKKFSTPKIRRGTWPFIYISGVQRNTDGSFKPGGRIPLRLFNPNDVSSVRWYFDGKEIFVGEDCYWHIPGSGTLRAVAVARGGITILEKKINVR